MTCKCDCDFECTCENCTLNPACKMSCLKRFEVALETRNFEINLFWKRSNYFLVLNTAIAVGFVSFIKKDLYMVKDMESYIQALVLCFIGVVVCIVWFKVNLGSKYWQSYWEQNLDKSANNMKLCFFTTKTEKWVEENLKDNKEENKKQGWRKWWESSYDDLVLKKPSVSKCMTFLSLFFLVVWILVGGFISYEIGEWPPTLMWALFWVIVGAIFELFQIMAGLIIMTIMIGCCAYGINLAL